MLAGKTCVCAAYEVLLNSSEILKGDVVLGGCDGAVAGKTRV